jgi:hypothetical protein
MPQCPSRGLRRGTGDPASLTGGVIIQSIHWYLPTGSGWRRPGLGVGGGLGGGRPHTGEFRIALARERRPPTSACLNEQAPVAGCQAKQVQVKRVS